MAGRSAAFHRPEHDLPRDCDPLQHRQDAGAGPQGQLTVPRRQVHHQVPIRIIQLGLSTLLWILDLWYRVCLFLTLMKLRQNFSGVKCVFAVHLLPYVTCKKNNYVILANFRAVSTIQDSLYSLIHHSGSIAMHTYPKIN